MITPIEAASWADSITKVYEEATDQIMVNLARHFNVAGNSGGAFDWQMQKLAEMGQFNQENIKTVAKLTGQNPELIQIALENAAGASLKAVEPILAEAAIKGYLSAAPTVSQAVKTILANYEAQAVDKYNLVNTVMLDSAMQSYRKVVSNTIMYEQTAMTAEQQTAAQTILNVETGKTVLGVSSRTEAVRRAIKDMANAGLAGFVDRGGHNWSPEAYVNMDIRTTATNTAHKAVFARCDDYGVDLIEVTSHAGARPGCEPYQGKIYARNGPPGEVEDLNGRRIRYGSLKDTSYGEPAGLFGINCGHFSYPFIPGYSLQRNEPTEDKTENAKDYAESQQQRYLERQVRYAKRDAMMAKASGDTEMFDKYALKVKQKQSDLNGFILETGRTKRLDRTQVPGYNKDVANAVTKSAKRQTAQ